VVTPGEYRLEDTLKVGVMICTGVPIHSPRTGPRLSTRAIKSGSATDDSTYTNLEGKIEDLTSQHDALATQIKTMLNSAEFQGTAIDQRQAQTLIKQARTLLKRADELARQTHD
jgi:hypothetical protein